MNIQAVDAVFYGMKSAKAPVKIFKDIRSYTTSDGNEVHVSETNPSMRAITEVFRDKNVTTWFYDSMPVLEITEEIGADGSTVVSRSQRTL